MNLAVQLLSKKGSSVSGTRDLLDDGGDHLAAHQLDDLDLVLDRRVIMRPQDKEAIMRSDGQIRAILPAIIPAVLTLAGFEIMPGTGKRDLMPEPNPLEQEPLGNTAGG